MTPEELIPDAPHSDGEIRSAVRQKSRPVRFAERLAGERDEHPEVLVNAGAIVLKTAEVKLLSSAGQAAALGWPFFGGLPRRLGIGAGVGGAMMALERTCSGMSSACCRSR